MITYRYTALLDTADGETTARDITAADIMTAHHIAADLAATYAEATGDSVDRVRLYAATTDADGGMDGAQIMEAARIIVRRTTANAVKREGGEFQYRLWRECRKPSTDNADVNDMICEASAALVNAIADGLAVDEQYHAAYLAVNRYLRSIRAINLSVTAMRTVYIEDIDGDIIDVNGQIAAILSPGARYNPTFDTATAAEDEGAQADAAVIASIVQTLTPVQVEIVKRLARGHSLRQIAADTHRTAGTIADHVKKIRVKASALFPDIAAAVTAAESRAAMREAARQAAENNRYFDTDIWH